MNPNNDPKLTERILLLLAEALQAPAEVITTELSFGDIPQWDSMGHMEVMMRLEEEFGVEVNTDTISDLTSIPAIRAYIQGQSHA